MLDPLPCFPFMGVSGRILDERKEFAMSYAFFNKRYQRSEMIKFCETIIQKAREELKDYFSFSHRIIGSGKTNLMTINGNDKHVDLDYNLLIERNKKGITDAKEMHTLFFNALRKAIGNRSSVHESTSVFTVGIFPLDGYQFSFDVAIIEGNGNGIYQKIIFDKQNNRFIWNKYPIIPSFGNGTTISKRQGNITN